jgi:hypothetical protein
VSWLTDLAGVYGRVLRRAFELTLQHWWLGLVAIAYLVAFGTLAVVAGQLGFAGGFLLGIGMAALMSSWLVLVGHVVRNGRVTIADVPESFLVYMGDVLTFLFLRFALNYVAKIAFADVPLVAIVFDLATFVFLNAVPEQIYLGGNTGVAVFVESYRFVGTYWIEWLPATALLAVLLALATLVPFPPLALVLGGIVMAFGFIMRGLLFLELTTSSRRAREFARRSAG